MTMAYVRSFLRCYLAGASFNSRGMQSISLAFAMQPGLEAIHKDPRELRMARKRYVRHYQSHPFWMPCLVGIFLNAEKAIASGSFPPGMLQKVKDTTAYTLSAIGDSVFAGSLLIFWALATVCLLLSGLVWLPFILGLALFIGLQAFRAHTFRLGLREGFRVLEKLRRWDLINWGGRIKVANALLLVWLWSIIWPMSLGWQWVLGVAALLTFGALVRTGGVFRVVAVAFVVAIYQIFPTVIDNIDKLAGN